jgi:hypothetical protein
MYRANRGFTRAGIQALALGFLMIGAAATSFAEDKVDRIAVAPVDEWFYGMGDERNHWLGGQIPGTEQAAVPEGAVGKRNGGYVWAMASVGDNLWFSVLNNGWCGWMMVSLNIFPSQSSHWACETYSSSYPDQAERETDVPWVDGATIIQNDWREPYIYWRESATGRIHKATSDHPTFKRIMARSFGFRAAGSFDGVVFMASNPLVQSDKSVFVLAFDGRSGEFIDGIQMQNYVNIRRFLTVKHADGSEALYLLLGSEMHSSNHPNHLLRWSGTRGQPFGAADEQSATPGFDIVGDLGDAGSGAEFIAHRNRLLVTTWGGENTPAGLYQSGLMPAGGFTEEQPAIFHQVFSVADFEPDPIIANAWLMGAITEYRGQVYWGTMHPGGQAFTHLMLEHPSILFNVAEVVPRTHRGTHLFRTDFSDPEVPKTELLYGASSYWTYNDGDWDKKPNRMGLEPLLGEAGFGDYFNEYTWTLIPYQGSLYIGTFDISGPMNLVREGIDCGIGCFVLNAMARHEGDEPRIAGFDLFRLDDPQQPAAVLTRDGFGNPANNGVRNALVLDDALYFGTSSYTNLPPPEGQAGWELINIRRDEVVGSEKEGDRE